MNATNETLATLNAALMLAEIEADQALIDPADWDLVVSCLSYQGEKRSLVPSGVANHAWTLADGFGKCSLYYIHGTLEWDWSHIRDSSAAAVAEMAAYLRQMGF